MLCQFSSVQSLSRVRLFVTPWIAARQASLSITNSWTSLRLTSIESVMPSSHLILCRPLLLLPPIPPSIRVFSKESTLCMRWPKYWSFSFSIIPSKEIPGLISFRMDWLHLLAVQGTLRSLLQHHYPLLCRSIVVEFSSSHFCTNKPINVLSSLCVIGSNFIHLIRTDSNVFFLIAESWESLGLQGDPTSPFWRRSALGFLWKEWC